MTSNSRSSRANVRVSDKFPAVYITKHRADLIVISFFRILFERAAEYNRLESLALA